MRSGPMLGNGLIVILGGSLAVGVLVLWGGSRYLSARDEVHFSTDIRPPIAFCLTPAVLPGSVNNRGSETNLFAQTLSHFFDPNTGVGAVDDASQEAQAFAGVVPIATDILFYHFCI